MRSDVTGIRAFSRTHFAVVTAVIAIMLTAAVSLPAAEQRVRGEYEVKAALLYNFLKFVEWPPSKAAGAEIRVCVVGDLSRARSVAELDNQRVAGRRLAVERADLQDVRGCDVLFLLRGEEQLLPKILEAVRGGSTLTIGEADGLGRRGVIINFLIVRNRVRFEINAAAARDAGIMISSKLMKLAGGNGSTAGGD
ncbi:MAG: hypothetical protein A2010_18350 [Nitrospirae bacterium GWD2_57_9]|nr:MAG: hypothetical protein A2010_18350 [Nitrospirae bacterium GWD2_57_9]